jgi:hypothetical protein
MTELMFRPHQIEKAEALQALLQKHKQAYLAGAPRSGKTRTALKLIQNLNAEHVLVLCPKNAIPGWRKEMEATDVRHPHVTNYEQCKNIKPQNWDMVVLDEAHSMGAFPRPSQRTKDVKRHVLSSSYFLAMSGTPCVESPSQLYHSFFWMRATASNFCNNFYDWHRLYGIPKTLFFSGRRINDYTKCMPEVMEGFGRMCVTMTQEDAGIQTEVTDQVHTLKASLVTENIIEQLKEHGVTRIDFKPIVAESEMAARALIHQVESGALHFNNEYLTTGSTEVLDYVNEHWSQKDTAVMCHYRATQRLFGEAGWGVFSSQAHAEGVDLSRYHNLVIVNSGYSGIKHVQRRERQVNLAKSRDNVTVHHIVVDCGISPSVWEAVTHKRDFNLAAFRQWRRNA